MESVEEAGATQEGAWVPATALGAERAPANGAMAATSSAMRHVSATEPSASDLYVPPERFRSGPDGTLVWDVMRLCISKPGAIWCTVCKAWYKYHAGSMPSLVRHCSRLHADSPANKTAARPHNAPSGPPAGGPPLPVPVAPVAPGSPAAPLSPKKSPAPPSPHTSNGPPLPLPVSPTGAQRPVAANSTPKPPPPKTSPKKAPPAKSPPAKPPPPKAPPAKTPAAGGSSAPACSPAKTAAVGAGGTSNSAGQASGGGSASASGGGAGKRRAQAMKVIAAPDAVRRVAERCQSLLFESTGMTFFNVKFQVPRSKDEALSVIRSGIRDMEKSEDSRKMYFLGWAHSQIFSAEMAALGYRFLTAGIRCDTTMTKPPPIESWLTLELPLRGHARKKARVAKGPQTSAATPSAATGATTATAPKTPQPVVAGAAAQPVTPKKDKSAATPAQTTKGSPGAAGKSSGKGRKQARIIDTIDLT